ncbi:hypothetical protein IH781_04160 [Patescibacteria group bacterium]|nr:hypothetical protein [Patescibacteria group bacterium]
MTGEKGTCAGCGTADVELNDDTKCENCGGMAAASTDEGDSADKTDTDEAATEGDDSSSDETTTTA